MPSFTLEYLCAYSLSLTSNISYRRVEVLFVQVAGIVAYMCLLLLPEETMNWIISVQRRRTVLVQQVAGIVRLKEGIGSSF
jgi:hypothetical protein